LLTTKHKRQAKSLGIIAVFAIILSSSFFGVLGTAHAQAKRGLPCGQNVGCPTGLASYGYDHTTGNSYSIRSNMSIGYVSFTALQANNSQTPFSWASGDPKLKNSSTLQLNDLLVVNNTDGSEFTYWPQNVLTFGNNSNTPTVVFADNILNVSSVTGEHSIPEISSQNGTIVGNSTMGYYYGNYLEAPYFAVEKPFAAEQIMTAYTIPSYGAVIYFDVYVLQNGSSTPNRSYQYDKVVVSDPQISNSYFYVAGPAIAITPLGSYYDSEYVFAGNAGGATTTFSSMNATIGLFYGNLTNPSLTPFPSYYSYGSDTAESASNLLVNYLGAGYADVTLGTPYYGALTQTTSTSITSNSTSSNSSSTTQSRTATSSTQSTTQTSPTTELSPTTSTTISTTSFTSSIVSSSASTPPTTTMLASSSSVQNQIQRTTSTSFSSPTSTATITSSASLPLSSSHTTSSPSSTSSTNQLEIGAIGAVAVVLGAFGLFVIKKR
jgi:thermopsin